MRSEASVRFLPIGETHISSVSPSAVGFSIVQGWHSHVSVTAIVRSSTRVGVFLGVVVVITNVPVKLQWHVVGVC